MRISHLPSKVLLGLVVAFFIVGSSSPVWAQAGSYKEINPKGQKANSIPVSDRTIRFEVTLPSDKVVKMLIKEGGMAKTGDLHEGYAFAFVPLIKDIDNESASFTIFQLTQDKAGNESIRQLERLDADSKAPTFSNTEPKLQIRVISIEKPKASLIRDLEAHTLLALAVGTVPSVRALSLKAATSACLSEPSAGERKKGKKDCCVQCGGVWACALCVWMSCGCCCDEGPCAGR